VVEPVHKTLQFARLPSETDSSFGHVRRRFRLLVFLPPLAEMAGMLGFAVSRKASSAQRLEDESSIAQKLLKI
jgi:hypothetical protein